jgi:DnaJ-class molecular chaperone
MFVNYYLILDADRFASEVTIKSQYKKLAKKWHPDINKSHNATEKMQEIIEAYLILGNSEARIKYNNIYDKQATNNSPEKDKEQEQTTDKEYANHESYNNAKFEDDPILHDWILKAKEQSNSILHQILSDTKGVANSGCLYTFKSLKVSFIVFVIIVVLLYIIGLLRNL